MTRPNVRSEPGEVVSSRLKFSWVDWSITSVDKAALKGWGALSNGSGKVPPFLTFFDPGRHAEERGFMQEKTIGQPGPEPKEAPKAEPKPGFWKAAFAPRRVLLNA